MIQLFKILNFNVRANFWSLARGFNCLHYEESHAMLSNTDIEDVITERTYVELPQGFWKTRWGGF